MAVKVVYDSTRGLVQENDATGVGGFQIKDVSLTEGSEEKEAAAAGADAILTATGVSLVDVTGDNHQVQIPKGTVIGQQKTVIVKIKQNANAAHNLHILGVDSGDAAQVLVGDNVIGQGDVVVCVWSGAAWLVVNQTT